MHEKVLKLQISPTTSGNLIIRNVNTVLLFFFFFCSFRHAALRSITRQKQIVKEPDKDHEQLNLLTKSFCGSKMFGAGIYCWRIIFHVNLYRFTSQPLLYNYIQSNLLQVTTQNVKPSYLLKENLELFCSKSACCHLHEVSNACIVIWLENVWYFGKLVIEKRWRRGRAYRKKGDKSNHNGYIVICWTDKPVPLFNSSFLSIDDKAFSFSAASYSVVKSAKMLTIEVQLNQRISRFV